MLEVKGIPQPNPLTINDPVRGGTAGSVLFVDASGNLGQDNDNLFWDDSNNRLEVANISLGAPVLETIGDTGIVIPSGSGGDGSYGFSYATNNAASRSWRLRSDQSGWGFFDIEQSTTQSGTTFAAKFTIDNNGNVGIGATTPTNILELKNLTTVPVLVINGANASVFRGLSLQADGSNVFFDRANTSTGEYRREAGQSVAFGGFQTFYIDTVEMARINSTGIGIGTTGPLSKLDVNGAPINWASANAPRSTGPIGTLDAFDPTTMAAGVGGALTFGGNYISTTNAATFAAIRGLKENVTSGDAAGSLSFYTAASGGALTKQVTILSTGFVGIGTTTPLALFHVSTSDTEVSRFQNTSTEGLLSFYTGSGAGTRRLYLDWTTTDIGLVAEYGNLNLSAGSGGVARSNINIGYSEIVFNEAANDVDVRIESDTNTNHFVSDAGLLSGVGGFGFGAAASTDTNTGYVYINPPAFTVASNASYAKLEINNSGAMTVAGATTSAWIAAANFDEPNITATGTVNDAYTVRIGGAPTEGTRNGALWVAAGATRLGAQIIFDGTTTSSGAGAVGITGSIHEITTTGTGDALTLADGQEGQRLTVIYVAEGAGTDTAVLTPTNFGSGTTITFSVIGQSARLIFTNGKWYADGDPYGALIA